MLCMNVVKRVNPEFSSQGKIFFSFFNFVKNQSLKSLCLPHGNKITLELVRPSPDSQKVLEENEFICFSCGRLFATLWTVAHQTPLCMGFSWQEY